MSRKIVRFFTGLFSALVLSLSASTPALAAAPANDNFANAEVIGSLPFSTSVDNTEATAEANEPIGCSFPTRTVWYSFTPTQNMAVRIDMVGSQVSSSVSIFLASGPAFSDLTFLTCTSGSNFTNFQVDAGQTYYLQVDSFGQAGVLQLNLQEITPPANDRFANADVISALPFSASIDNTNATVEPGEPVGCGSLFRSVWYSFTPAQTMALQVDMTGSQVFGSVVAFVASGPTISDLGFVACISNGGSSNILAEAGKTYYLRVDSSGQPGTLQINLQQITPPANDNFADAEVIGSLPFSASVDNTNATVESGEPVGCGALFRSTWYSFTPTQNMAVQVVLPPGQMFGAVSIFLASGSSFSDLHFLTCATTGSSTNFQADAGETYYLRVDGFFGLAGVLQFNLQQITPPANDRFADAEVINSLPFSASVDNTNATAEFGEPQGCNSPFRSVWYSFTPAENMTVRLNSPGNGALNIFLASGPSFADLTSLACAYSGTSTNVQIEAGQTYFLRVDSFSQPGLLQFSVEQITPPANDNFANAEPIGSLPYSASVDNTNATSEFGEPQGCGFPFRTVWYSFTPAQNMALRVDMSGSQAFFGNVSIFLASGPTFSDLTPLGCAGNSSSTNFQVEAGQTYYLRVDSFGQPGVLHLNLTEISPPANDNFADAEVISSLPFNTTVDNTDATSEVGEPQGCNFPFRTVWYSFTPAQNMAIRVSGPSQGAVNIFLASGPSFADLSSLACVYGSTPDNLQIEGGQTYYFRVDSSYGQPGILQFSLEQIFPPVNDNFAGAQAIGSLPFSVTVDNTDATTEPGEPYSCFLSRSLWYSFTPTENMALRVSMAGSSISGNVSVFLASGPAISDLTLVTCAGSSPAYFQAEAGKTYYLRLDSFGQAGFLQLNLQEANPPANDNLTNAELIGSAPFNTSVDITDATTEPNEPQFCYFMPKTIWYSFTPAETVTLRANTFGSAVSGNVNIYRSSGTGFSGLQFLNCSGPSSSPSFQAEAGQTYYLQVGSAFGEPGTVNLNLVQTNPPLNDNLANAIAVTSLPFSATVDLTDATNEPGEPQVCNFMPNTAWYSFTPAEAIKLRADAQGGAIIGNVNIYHASGTGFPDLQFIGCSGFGGVTTFLAQAGETYYFQVGGSGQAGTIQFNLAEVLPITGRVIDAVTGAPLPGNAPPFALVTLQRVCGDGCFEFVNSQYTDGDGRFLFDSYYYGAPLSEGNYRLEIAANLYLPAQFGPFEFSGATLDLGDVPISPPSTIRGRAVDADTGNPLAGTSVTLYRCNAGDCTEFVNSQFTDENGLFLFNSFWYGPPLPGGTYRLDFSDGLHETRQIEVALSDGEDRDLGDVALTPLPLIGSISGKIVDAVTGQPVAPTFGPSLALYRCTNGICDQWVSSQVPDSLGRFQFNTDYNGNPIPAGTFQIQAGADQYQFYVGNPFTVGEAENKNVGNVGLTSYPVRFSEVQTCNDIPATGGDCVYSVKITNGQPIKLEGLAWSLVNSYLPDSFAHYTDFRAGDNQGLSLAPGKSKVLQFRFTVPANQSSYGSFVCTRIFIGQGNNPLLTTIGFRSMFCVTRNASGFTVASPTDIVPTSRASITASTGSELEPNNSCQTAQDLGNAQYPFVLDGALDSSQTPDVDYYRFTGTPGSLTTIDLEGQGTGKGTLGDPFLGFFDSNCNLVAINDDGGGFLNSRLEITVPSDGVFVMAATQCCDYGFFGGGNGSYQLSVTLVQYLGSISGVVTDAVSGKPLRGDAAPFASVRLLQSTQFGWAEVNSQMAGADGHFNFTSDSNGTPLRVGNYLVIASADQYLSYQTQSFSVGEGENHDIGNVPLTSFPVRFSEVQPCAVPTDGAICEFSVKITNGLATRLSGQAWSIINAYGIGTFTDFTNFQTDVPLDVSLARGQSKVLTFRFRVRGSVRDGAYMCASVYVGQNPNSLFNTVGQNFLFCFAKGSSGFTLMSEKEMHQQLLHQKIQEFEPKKVPSVKK